MLGAVAPWSCCDARLCVCCPGSLVSVKRSSVEQITTDVVIEKKRSIFRKFRPARTKLLLVETMQVQLKDFWTIRLASRESRQLSLAQAFDMLYIMS